MLTTCVLVASGLVCRLFVSVCVSGVYTGNIEECRVIGQVHNNGHGQSGTGFNNNLADALDDLV